MASIMASTTAGTTMAATVMARQDKHGGGWARWRERPSQGMTSRGTQRPASIFVCLRQLRRKCDDDQLSNYCTATGRGLREPASTPSKLVISRVLRCHLPYPALIHPRHWDSPWFWLNFILLNLSFAHPRHWGLWLWRTCFLLTFRNLCFAYPRHLSLWLWRICP
jgi:hypothetical protein